MTLLLDPDIRDWVVLPLFVIMVAAGLLRHALGQVLQAPPQKTNHIVQRAQNKAAQLSKVRSGACHYLTTEQWDLRRLHAVKMLQDEADWCEAEQEREVKSDSTNDVDPMTSMMDNPMSMMKGNIAFMIQNMVMMQGIQHFFSGYILLKVPFSLTVGFKSMFQKGVAELPDLDSSYVSSVSWYFLVMYGLRSFFQLAVGEASLETRETMQRQAYIGMQPPAAKSQTAETMAKALRQEAENLEMLPVHTSQLDSVEKRLLGKRMPRKKNSVTDGSSADFLFASSKSKKKTN